MLMIFRIHRRRNNPLALREEGSWERTEIEIITRSKGLTIRLSIIIRNRDTTGALTGEEADQTDSIRILGVGDGEEGAEEDFTESEVKRSKK